MGAITPERIARLWAEHNAALVLYAQQRCDTPEDVVQHAFLLLVEQTTLPDNPVGWLYRVVRNRAMDAARNSRRKSCRETVVAHRGEPWFEPAAGERLDAVTATEALKGLPEHRARGDRSPAVGRVIVRGDRPTGGRLRRDRQSLLSSRAGRLARKVKTAMCADENREEELKQLEAELASLVPRGDRVDPGWGSLLAAKAAGVASFPLPCDAPPGHVFVCVYCGKAADQATAAARWAWPTSLAAMTCLAAVLLAVLVARSGPRAVDYGSVPGEPGRTSPAEATAPPWNGSDRPILTAADTELPGNFLTLNGRTTGGKSASVEIEASDARFRNSELLQRLLHERGADGDPPIL